MQLGLTIPLMRHLGIGSLPPGGGADRRACWDLHVITLQGRASLLAVHCESRYSFVLLGPSQIEWQALAETFLRGLNASLAAAGLAEEPTQRYLARAGAPTLTKTHGRREVAFLNRAWEDMVALDYAAQPDGLGQPLLDAAVNALPRRCAGFDGLAPSLDRLRAALAQAD